MDNEWKHLGIHIDTEREIVDVYMDGVRYEGAALAAPVRVSFDKGELKLKVTVWARKDGEDSDDS